MTPFKRDPYPNPIDTKRHPELEDLDLRFRRQAAGLPVAPLSKADSQFLRDAGAWLTEKTSRAESDRILAELQHKTLGKGRRSRQVPPSIKERMALADRLLPDKNVPRHLRYDQLQHKSNRSEQR
jgi:hypothetical protein